ncbi:MAG: hypothetical protein KQI35_07470 [Bacteroidetes bacterium]|nr:hypothetical protein [Bacteroidota bacterium]
MQDTIYLFFVSHPFSTQSPLSAGTSVQADDYVAWCFDLQNNSSSHPAMTHI